MNTKWFSGIGLAVLLSTGTLIYTTKTQARQSAATAAKPDASMENLTTCATEKNPAYLESVLKGSITAFDKDATAALKAGKPAGVKKASATLLKVIKFLFVQSKHFSPIYKNAAHKAIFDKDINKLIQKLFAAEYALAKSKSAQKEVVKDFKAVVADLTKDGVENLTAIKAPEKKVSAFEKIKGGLGKAGQAISGGAKKAAAGAKKAGGNVANGAKNLAQNAKSKIAPDDAADEEDGVSEEDAPADEEASDDSSDELQSEDAGTFEPEDDGASDEKADAEPTDEEASDDSSDDLLSEDAGTFGPEDDGASDEDAPADEEADTEATDEEADTEATDDGSDEE